MRADASSANGPEPRPGTRPAAADSSVRGLGRPACRKTGAGEPQDWPPARNQREPDAARAVLQASCALPGRCAMLSHAPRRAWRAPSLDLVPAVRILQRGVQPALRAVLCALA